MQSSNDADGWAMHDTAGALVGRRVLIIEDEYFVASEIKEVVQKAGAAVEGPYGHIEQAAAAVRSNGFDLAVLDINLRGTLSFPIAEKLHRRGVGFVFVTGYAAELIPEKWRHIPRCEKPCHDDVLVSALAFVCRKAAAVT